MHSLVTVNNKEIKNAKDVNKNIVKKIKHKECVDAIFNKILVRHKMKRIQSKLHKLEPIMFPKLFCLVLMMKGIFLMMVLVVWPIFIRM